MTSINRLTQVQTLDDKDLAVIWQDENGRTRSISIANFRKFIQSTDPNADAFTQVTLEGDELVFLSHGEEETRVDINLLPQKSITELKDTPSALVAGNYLKVNDEGSALVFTPASEISAAIIVEDAGQFLGIANTLNFEGFEIELSNRTLRVAKSAKTSGYVYQDVTFGDQPTINSDADCGIDYIFIATELTQGMLVNGSNYTVGSKFRVTNQGENPSKPIEVQIESAHGTPTYFVQSSQEFEFYDGAWRPVLPDSITAVIGNATAATRGIQGGLGINLQQELNGLTRISSSAKNITYLTANEETYQVVDRQYPVTSDDAIDDFHLIAIKSGVDGLPVVEQVQAGQLASGFAVNQDGQLFSIASGTYDLSLFPFVSTAAVYDKIYVDSNGKLTLTETNFIAGWVIDSGVLIDVDLYNSTVIQDYNPIGVDERVIFAEANATGLLKTEDGGSSIAELASLQGDRKAQAVAFKNFKHIKAEAGGEHSWVFDYYNESDLYEFLPVVDGTLFVCNNNQDGSLKFTYNTSAGAVYIAELTISEDFNDWRRLDRNLIQTQQIELVRQGKTGDDKVGVSSVVKIDENGWLQVEHGVNLVIWHVGSGGNKTRTVTFGSTDVNFEKPVKLNGVDIATVDQIPDTDFSSWTLKNKVSYDNATVNTESSGQGNIYEFLGNGSTSATHTHTFNDSGVAWVANFQVTSTKPKTVEVETSVGSVGLANFTIPVNMIARFSYNKSTNKMYAEVSYIRPELIGYEQDQDALREGLALGQMYVKDLQAG